MKVNFLLCALIMLLSVTASAPTYAVTRPSTNEPLTSEWAAKNKANANVQALSPEMLQMSVNAFLTLTPSKYKAMTGHKLGFKKTLALKAAQKMLKKDGKGGDSISKGLFIVLAIIGLGWIGCGLNTGWDGNDWWVCLLLTALCWLPGVIYALVKMKNYY
jgi:uncharacterized membrane protein YqaE (UPF0057 family)